MPIISDRNLLDEEQHWDSVAEKGGRMKINSNSYIARKSFENMLLKN